MQDTTRTRSPGSAGTGLTRRIRRGVARRAERWLGALGLVEPRQRRAPVVEKVAEPAPIPAPAPVEVKAAPEPAAVEPTPAGPGIDPAAVQALFDDMVRPALQADGGDITLVKVVGGDVYVRLVGACSSCPSSTLTVKVGIERLLEEELPGFERLVQVGPDGSAVGAE